MGFRQFSSVVLAVTIMMIPLKPNCGRAAVLQVNTNTTYHCNGLLNGCDDHDDLIADDLLSELEQLMDFNVIRILLKAGLHITQQALDAAEAVVSQQSCPRYKKDTPSYTNCIDKALKNKRICHKGSVYDRC